MGRALSPDQLQSLADEHSATGSLQELLDNAGDAIRRAHAAISSLREADFGQTCYVGRARIAVPAIGLAIHIAEHTQRHLGQLIVLCRIARSE